MIHPNPSRESAQTALSTDAQILLQTGFAQHFETEALPGALPEHNSPQSCPYGLYAEQFSGSAFTAPRASNRRSWLYRLRPSAAHGAFVTVDNGVFDSDSAAVATSPDPLRWDPLAYPQDPSDFVEGLTTYACNGDPNTQTGCAILMYAARRSMSKRAFYDADGELLIVPQEGRLLLVTEFGRIPLDPLEVAIIPRGVRFAVQLLDAKARGYVCENFGAPFRLPDLGPIGSNGLACERDFRTPVAWFEDTVEEYELVARFGRQLWSTRMDRSPFDVVAWRGNCAPSKYDLRQFNTIGSISYDHPDPSIFLVLHSTSDTPGVDNIDFVIFPPRWLVMEGTFRPPWFHRNIASEFMGLICGEYDAKAGGFFPGGASLHNCMRGHGPDRPTVERAMRVDTRGPERIANTMAFMFETRWPLRPTRRALDSSTRQRGYALGWQDIPVRFTPDQR